MFPNHPEKKEGALALFEKISCVFRKGQKFIHVEEDNKLSRKISLKTNNSTFLTKEASECACSLSLTENSGI